MQAASGRPTPAVELLSEVTSSDGHTDRAEIPGAELGLMLHQVEGFQDTRWVLTPR